MVLGHLNFKISFCRKGYRDHESNKNVSQDHLEWIRVISL